MLSYIETHETHCKKAYLYRRELENIYISSRATYCPFKVLKPSGSGKVCLCSIEIDGAWGFCGRSLCKLQPGRSAGMLHLRNKKPRTSFGLVDCGLTDGDPLRTLNGDYSV